LDSETPDPRDVDGWFVSSFTNPRATCVEIKFAKQGGILVRDSKDWDAAARVVSIPTASWAVLLRIINRSV
jgi:hypothetical protein